MQAYSYFETMVTSYEVGGMRSIQAGMPIVYIPNYTGAPFSCRLRADQREVTVDFRRGQDLAETITFMYRRPILCTLYGAVDFLNVLKKYIMYL